MKKARFQEGQEGKDKFERTTIALFRVKKTELDEKIKEKAKKGKG